MTDQQNAALEPCKLCGRPARIGSGYVKCSAAFDRDDGPECEVARWWVTPETWQKLHAPAGAEAVREAYAIGALAMAHYYHGDYAGDEFKGDHAGRAMRPEHIEWAKANAHVLPAALAKAPSTGEGGESVDGYVEDLYQAVKDGVQLSELGVLAAWCQSKGYTTPTLTTPQPAPTAAADGLREFVESIVNAMGPYPDLNGHPIISAAYAALRAKPEASGDTNG